MSQSCCSPETAETTGELRSKVGAALDRIRPYIRADGGDIELINVHAETGVVEVSLRGACDSCSCASATLKGGVERLLKEQVPGVTEVVAV